MPSSMRRAESWLRRIRGWANLYERTSEPLARRAAPPLSLERLEDRINPVQITYVWTNGDHDGLWGDSANWTNNGPANLPAGDTAVLEFDSGTAAATPAMSDNLSGLAVDEIHFAAVGGATSVGYTINGSATLNLGSAAGVVVDSGFGVNGDHVPMTFGSGILFNQKVASNIINNDLNSVVTIQGPVALNGFALTTNGVYSLVGNVASGDQGVTFGGVISGAGGLNLNGFVLLQGANTYTGVTTLGNLSNAIVAVANNQGLGNPGNTTVLSSNSISGLNLDGSSSVTQANLTIEANNYLIAFESQGTWNGPITLGGGTDNLESFGTGARLTINGAIGGGGALNVVGGDTPGVVEFQQNNTYTGVTTVGGSVAETLQVDTPAGLGAGGSGNGTTVASGSTLQLNYTSGAALQDAGDNAEPLTLTGAGVNGLGALQMVSAASALISGAVTLGGDTTIGVGSGVLTFGAAIGESTTSNLTIADDSASGGTGTVLFNAADTYSGTTTVNGGTLQVNATEPGDFTIAPSSGDAAVLDGSGSVGAVIFDTSASGNLGAKLAPGVGFNTAVLKAQTVTLTANSTFSSQLDGSSLGSGYSQLNCNGPLNLNNATLSIGLGDVFAPDTTFTIVQDSLLNGFFGNANFDGAVLNDNGYQFEIHYTANTVTATILNNPTTQTTTVNVTQANQPVNVSFALQFPAGTTGVTGSVTFRDASGHEALGLLSFNPATAQLTATGTFTPQSVGLDAIDAFYEGPYLPPGNDTPAPAPTLAFGADPVGLQALQVAVSYDQFFTAIGGDGAYTFTVLAAQLPPGMTLSPAGELVGTPTGGGSFSLQVHVGDASAGLSADNTYSFTVSPPNIVLSPTADTLPTGQVDVPYSLSITATGGTAGYTFQFSGSLPAGLTLTTHGLLSGTPTASGPFSFTVVATDSSAGQGPYPSAGKLYTLTVMPAMVTITTSLTQPQVGVIYDQQLAASGGIGPYTFSHTGQLPTGLTLTPTGLLSGTPTDVDSFPFTITATDSTPTTPVVGKQPYNLTVGAPTLALSPNTATLAVGTVGVAYSQSLAGSGGTAPYSYQLANATQLPAGLSLSSTTGAITGTPTAAGAVQFTVVVTDSTTGQGMPFSFSRTYTLNVNSSGVQLTPTTLPAAQLGSAYRQTLALSGGAAPDTFEVANGSMLPAGLTLSTSGVLSGTPAASGSFSFTIQATDSSKPALSASNTYRLIVASAFASAAVLKSDGSLVQYDASGNSHFLSAPGTILATSAVTDGVGIADVFVISELPGYVGTLWEYSAGNWMELSSGSFRQISAATNAQGQAVVFAILGPASGAPNTLWEQDPQRGVGTDKGWREASAGAFSAVSAVGTSAGAVAYAVIGPSNPAEAGTLWFYNAVSGGWDNASSGFFRSISTGLNASGQAVVYGVLADGSLWEQNPAFGPIGPDTGWAEVSGVVGAPAAYFSVSAGAADKVFAVASDRTLWEHTDAGWTNLSMGVLFGQVSGAPLAADNDVFAVLSDGSLWEYTDGPNWQELLTGGAAAASAP